MIILTSTAKQGLEPGAKVRIPYDKIHMLQRQDPVNGNQFTAVFILGFPPYAVEETPEQIDHIIDAEIIRLANLHENWQIRQRMAREQLEDEGASIDAVQQGPKE